MYSVTSQWMVSIIGNAVIEDGHSGASFALCLRRCQNILLNK